ncbi:MAG: hypothetical protein RLZZ326_1696 [Planctomycetota bacterium]
MGVPTEAAEEGRRGAGGERAGSLSRGEGVGNQWRPSSGEGTAGRRGDRPATDPVVPVGGAWGGDVGRGRGDVDQAIRRSGDQRGWVAPPVADDPEAVCTPLPASASKMVHTGVRSRSLER